MSANSDPRILGYCDISKLDGLMSKHFPSQIRLVVDELTEDPRTINDLNDYVGRGGFTHVFVPDEHFHRLEGDLKDCSVPVVELLGDHWVPWAMDRKIDYIQRNGIKDAVVFTDRFLEGYNGVANFHPVLTGFDEKVFRDQGRERDIDILVSGSLGKPKHELEVYPVRRWLAETLPKIGEERGLNVQFLEHPGYSPGDDRDYIREYADILNRSKICTGGSSHWRLPLKKLYEISASGSVLLTDLPHDDTDFFRDRVIEVDPNKMRDDGYSGSLADRICNVLGNYESSRKELQPFRSEGDRFDRSYEGKALEIRKVISGIKKA